MTTLIIAGAIFLSCSSPSKDNPVIDEQGLPAIIVEANTIVLTRASNPIGINLNYLRDPDVLRETGSLSLNNALTNFHGNWLRYPGGKKSNYYRFALPPYQEVNPQTLGWYATQRKNDVLDFDEYVTLAANVNASKYVVVAYDRERINDKTTTLQEYIDHAVGWVKYANLKGAKVKYWEIGNENWNNFKGSTWPEVVQDLIEIARAMRAADAEIKLGTNFDNEEQLNELLKQGGTKLDFVSCSNYYPGTKWGNLGFKFYEEQPGVGLLMQYETFKKVTKNLGLHPEFVIAECNAKQWEGSWTDLNDTGHALVCFDLCAQINQASDITTGMFWNTSWFDTENNSFNLFTGKNELRPNARSVKVWNDFWKPHAVKTESVLGLVTYALKNDSGALTLFVINKTNAEKKAAVNIKSSSSYTQNNVQLFAGNSGKDNDRNPALQQKEAVSLKDNKISNVSFPAYSITIIDLK